ncbi:MAG: lytic murein transglycosylase B [Sinobacteraceae bacterium]|nr:lytic murein transglycosylase B [Nevskiaceae bacterium]
MRTGNLLRDRSLTLLILCATIGGCVTPPPQDSAPPQPVVVPAPPPVVEPAPPVPPPATPQPFDLQRDDIRAFVEEVAARHSIPPEEIRALLAQGMSQPRILAAIARPAESVLKWWEYSARLVSLERINRGVEFARENRERLDAVHAATGVEPAYIVAIIGIETNYGRNKGSWRVLDALMTLGFDYPPRSRFFRSELEQFLLLVREERLDPLATLGSYAGAMGAPQFMPSSYRRYAVNGVLDGGRDSRRDLFNDWDDVIGSVANYFTAHGWQRDAPAVLEANTPPELIATLDRRNLELNDTLEGLRRKGVGLDSTLPPDTPAMLIPAELADRPSARVGLKNFQVITRYNRSILYAMAVNDLAAAIRQQTAAGPAASMPSPTPP